MLNNVVLIKGKEENYYTCDGIKIYYPEYTLQEEIDKKNITEPFIFIKDVEVMNKGKSNFIKGTIAKAKSLNKLDIINYIENDTYEQLIKIYTDDLECLYAVRQGDYCNIIEILADIGNGIEKFISIQDNGKNKIGFLRGLLKVWTKGTKKIDILLYQDEARTRTIARDAIELDENEALFLGAYLRLKTLYGKKRNKVFEFIDNKYVRYGNIVCFRTEDMWYFDSLNFIPYLGYEVESTVLDIDKIEQFIIDNMLTYSFDDEEIIVQNIRINCNTSYNIRLININVVDYYSLQTEELKELIRDCKEELEIDRKELGRNATRSNASLVSKLAIRNVIGLDE